LANLGRLNYKEHDYEKSLQYYQKLSQDKGYRVEAYLGMARAYLALNQIDQARNNYENALKVNANSDAAKLGVAKVNYAKKNYDEAMPVFRQIAKDNTAVTGAEAQFMIGQTLQAQGNYNEALKEYSKVKILYEAYDTWVSKALLNSADCYVALGKKGEAQSTLRSLVKKYPDTNAAKEAAKRLKSK
jgi:TolA-binding protein